MLYSAVWNRLGVSGGFCLASAPPHQHNNNNNNKDTMKEQKSENVISPMTAAFVAAQFELENPKFDCTNPHFRSKYASLAASRKAVIPTFAKHGISITQNVTTTALGATCVTTYRHIYGESLEFGPLFIPCAKSDAWGLGSCISYVLRYSLNSSAGISGEPDDDGEAACDAPAAAKPIFKKAAPAVTDQPPAQQRLAALIESSGIEAGAVQRFLAHKKSWPQGCERIEDLPQNICERLLNLQVWATVVEFAKNEVAQ